MELQKVLSESYKILVTKLKDSEAENTSSYSNLLLWKFPQFLWLKARNVKLLLLGISFMGISDDQQNTFRRRAHRIAEHHKFQGEWAEIEELLQLQNNAPGILMSTYFRYNSVEKWFGSDLKLIIKILRSGKTYNPYSQTKKPVKYPQRKRGYNDKGSLSRFDKLSIEYYITPKEITELPDLNNTPFYPDWYVKEKDLRQEALRVDTNFPTQEGGETND